MNTAAITKLQAAHRQLNAAIRLHFEGFDPVAVCTLAGERQLASRSRRRQPTFWLAGVERMV